MKKLVFLFVAAVAVSFASCGGNTQKAEAEVVDTVAVDTAACDSACADSVACCDSAAVK